MSLKSRSEVINQVFLAHPQRIMQVGGIEFGTPSPAAANLVNIFEHHGLPHVVLESLAVPEHVISEARLPETVHLHFPSTFHGRSFSIRGDEAPEQAISVKGAVIADDSILWAGTGGLPTLRGRQGLSFLPRVARVGSYLEARGVPSERVDAVFVHNKVVPTLVDGSIIMQAIKKFRQEFAMKVAIESTETNPNKRAVQKAIAANFTPAITVRSMPDNMRLVDLLKLTEAERVVKINRVYNREGRKDGVDPQAQYAFWAVRRMGETLATWHNELDLTHGYPHSGNWTAGAHLVDTDSVKGEPLGLGDEPITVQSILRDLRYIAKDFRSTGLVLGCISEIIPPKIEHFYDITASQLADFAIFVTQLYLTFASGYESTLKIQGLKNPALKEYFATHGNLDHELFVPSNDAFSTPIFEFARHLASFGKTKKQRTLIIKATRQELGSFLIKRIKHGNAATA